jgi:hypothetical protein
MYRHTKRSAEESRDVVVYRLDARATLPFWPERRQRNATWASVAVALEIVKEPGLKKLLRECLTSAGDELRSD